MPGPQNSNHEPGPMVSFPSPRHKHPQQQEAPGGRESAPRATRNPVVWRPSSGGSQRVVAALLTTGKGSQLVQAGGRPRGEKGC